MGHLCHNLRLGPTVEGIEDSKHGHPIALHTASGEQFSHSERAVSGFHGVLNGSIAGSPTIGGSVVLAGQGYPFVPTNHFRALRLRHTRLPQLSLSSP